MFSLIVVLVSIVLVALLAIVSIYYGGSAWTSQQANTTAAAVTNQGLQYRAALMLYATEHSGEYPLPDSQGGLASALVSGNYLQSLPTPPLGAMTDPSYAPNPTDWTPGPSNSIGVWVANKVNRQICQTINIKAGLNLPGIPRFVDPTLPVQCFQDALAVADALTAATDSYAANRFTALYLIRTEPNAICSAMLNAGVPCGVGCQATGTCPPPPGCTNPLTCVPSCAELGTCPPPSCIPNVNCPGGGGPCTVGVDCPPPLCHLTNSCPVSPPVPGCEATGTCGTTCIPGVNCPPSCPSGTTQIPRGNADWYVDACQPGGASSGGSSSSAPPALCASVVPSVLWDTTGSGGNSGAGTICLPVNDATQNNATFTGITLTNTAATPGEFTLGTVSCSTGFCNVPFTFTPLRLTPFAAQGSATINKTISVTASFSGAASVTGTGTGQAQIPPYVVTMTWDHPGRCGFGPCGPKFLTSYVPLASTTAPALPGAFEIDVMTYDAWLPALSYRLPVTLFEVLGGLPHREVVSDMVCDGLGNGAAGTAVGGYVGGVLWWTWDYNLYTTDEPATCTGTFLSFETHYGAGPALPPGFAAVTTSVGSPIVGAAAPAISSTSPSSVAPAGGTQIIVDGTNVGTATAVTVCGAPVTFYLEWPNRVTFYAPAHAPGVCPITVTTPVGSVTSAGATDLSYDSTTQITGVGPSGGYTFGGAIVEIYGSNLDGATAVNFTCAMAGVLPAAILGNSSNTITVASPIATTFGGDTCDITVVAAGGSATGSGWWVYYDDVPSLTAVGSGNGAAGTYAVTGGFLYDIAFVQLSCPSGTWPASFLPDTMTTGWLDVSNDGSNEMCDVQVFYNGGADQAAMSPMFEFIY